nr:MAG TPA: zinc binding domain protein [Caudoviricetes sp.]
MCQPPCLRCNGVGKSSSYGLVRREVAHRYFFC